MEITCAWAVVLHLLYPEHVTKVISKPYATLTECNRQQSKITQELNSPNRRFGEQVDYAVLCEKTSDENSARSR